MKKLINNFIFNIIASSLPIAILQLIILPYIASKLGSEKYGEVLTITAIISVVAMATGNILNNVRILMYEQYKEKKLSGDFNIILLIMLIINIIIMLLINNFYIKVNITSNILLIIYTLTYTIQLYSSAEYRYNMNYKKVMYSSIYMIIGYIVGLLLFKYTYSWELIYALGAIFSLIYQLFTTSIIKEPLKKTVLFKTNIKKTIILVITSLLINCMTYLDRLIIYPILGGENVTKYYIASLYGKIMSMGLTPISNVLLSHYTKKKTITMKYFWLTNMIIILFGFITWLLGFYLSRIVIQILYPEYINKIINIINIANGAAIISLVSSMIQPILLSYSKTKWQIFIQIIHILMYLVGITLFIEDYHLIGFCWISIIANTVRLIVMLIIGTMSIKNLKKSDIND